MTKQKILVVEDDDDLRFGLTLRLRALGYDTAEATDGYYAVSSALNERPDAVLLDIGLPGGDGISVLERYSRLPALSQVPVVVLTGRDPFVTEPAVRKYRIVAFLQKPADNDDLAGALSAALEGRTYPDDPDADHSS